jgi:hypothetical protein
VSLYDDHLLSESMIISYIDDKKKKRGHALPIGLVDRRINNAAVIGKVDIELREVREWCCVKERDFFCSDPSWVEVSKGLLEMG